MQLALARFGRWGLLYPVDRNILAFLNSLYFLTFKERLLPSTIDYKLRRMLIYGLNI